jgi:hypothetical protein
MDEKTQAAADALQNFDAEGTTILFGVVPLVAVAILAAVAVVIYLAKKKKMEADLASAMVDDGATMKDDDAGDFNTGDIQELDPTKPSARITGVRKKAE